MFARSSNLSFRADRSLRPARPQARALRFGEVDCPEVYRAGTRRRSAAASAAAFTLIEIMIVVGIMGVVLTMGVPIVYKIWHKAPMSQAITDIIEVCSHARALAIMQGRPVDVIFHPREGKLAVGSAPAPVATPAVAPPQSGQPGRPARAATSPTFSIPASPAPGSGLSAQLSERVLIEMMDINKLPHDFRDDDVARVRFYPNGTCDELTLILVSDQNERREILLEITTGLASVISDPRHFR